MKPKKSWLNELDAIQQAIDPSNSVARSSRPSLAAGLASKARRRRQDKTAVRQRRLRNLRLRQAATTG
jgi:hypothetical protein